MIGRTNYIKNIPSVKEKEPDVEFHYKALVVITIGAVAWVCFGWTRLSPLIIFEGVVLLSLLVYSWYLYFKLK